jgi:hypothetical protein
MQKSNTGAGWGLIIGVAITGSIGSLMYGITGQVLWVVFMGMGAGLGLVLGAGIDRAMALVRVEASRR